MAPVQPPTLGVEEEYLLVEPDSGHPLAVAEAVRAAAGRSPALDDDDVQDELLQVQLEVATPVCHDLDEVGGHLLRLRHELSGAAEGVQARLLAVGAAPWIDGPVPVAANSRYRDLGDRAPGLVGEQFVNGMHVHVAVPDRRAAIEVVNRLRADLPLVLALSGNSPFWRGRDSGFDSWRAVQFTGWPVDGVPPHFDGVDDYERRAEALVSTGAVRDRGQFYWMARPSERYPTVEVRCADVQLRVDDAVLIAGVVRALVATALDDAAAGLDFPELDAELVAASWWTAARHGLGGDLYDLRKGRLRRSGDLVSDLLDRLEPALDVAGDSAQVRALAERLLRDGTGAERQRSVVRELGLPQLASFLAEETVAIWVD